MLAIIFDAESDGFVEQSSTIHCLSGKDLLSHSATSFHGESMKDMIEYLDSAEVLIGHNIIGFDFDLIDKHYGWRPREDVKIIDTLVWSQVLNPDRQLPKGCPTSYKNPLTGRLDRITPHSLAAWGYRVARAKPQHYDWLTFSPAMLHRCEEDVEITEKVFMALLEEAEMTIEEALERVVMDKRIYGLQTAELKP